MEPKFSEAYLHATLLVSLMSVWVLVGLFYYLNRYTKREYFTIWTAAWLFYALWLTLSLHVQQPGSMTRVPDPTSLESIIKQACVAISAAFLLWGTLRFLGIYVKQMLFGLFILFLLAWTFVAPWLVSEKASSDPDKIRIALQLQVPVFLLLGCGSAFAGVCFYRLRRKMPFVGAGMLALGFLLWGVYLASYPFSQRDADLYSAGFFVAAVLQLFIAVSMIVLVLEEVRYHTEKVMAEAAEIRSQKEALEAKILTTEEKYREMYDQVRLTEGTQRAYEELRKTQQTVVQQERLRALGQMASGVAHDINNALSPITAYTELLLTTLTNVPDIARHYLRNIEKSAQDIASIVARMRDFYRRRASAEDFGPVNVNSLIQDVVDLTRPRWRDQAQRQGISIQIRSELDPELPPLASDASELREALMNLVFNSVDALPQGGTITLVTRLIKPDPAASDDAKGEQVVVEVRDDGIGMDEQTRQRCMEPFFTTKPQRGTGLGLAMVYGMMQRHEGSITVESAPSQGTVVRLVFPFRKAAPPVAKPVPPEPAAPVRALRVLCVEDEPLIRELLHDCLGNLGHTVALAEDGRRGLEEFNAALQKQQPFDVVITDLGMPEMDGHQVARAVKAATPRTPVIMLTGWGTMLNDEGHLASSVDAVVGKPPNIGELNELLLRLSAPTTAQPQP